MRKLLVVAVSAGLSFIGCQTITEELPTRPRTPIAVPVPVVTVAPLPAPVPTPNLPPPSTPSPTNPPAPAPTPTPDPGNGIPDNIPDNTSPVARVIAEVRFIVCNGVIEENSHNRPYARVGCIIYLDATPKDSSGKQTQAKGTPEWSYTNPGMFRYGGNNPYTPVITAVATGTSYITCTIDGIGSNQLTMQITN